MSHNHSNGHPPSRRNFLKLIGKGAAIPLVQSPLQRLIQTIIAGSAQRTLAAETGLKPRKLLHILQAGAPSRWNFDLFLSPYDKSIVSNSQVGTRYVNDGTKVTGLEYATILRQGINVPHLWQVNVPSASGGFRPMEDLLKNLVHIRGINIGNPDHAASQSFQFLPLGSSQSVSALSADASSAPIPAINAGLTSYIFKSIASKSSVVVSNSGNMLNNLLSPFNRKNYGSFADHRKQMDETMVASIKALDAAAIALHPSSDVLASSLDAARTLISNGFPDLDTTWSTLLTKYQTLIRRTLDIARILPGINDFPIITDGTTKYQADGEIITSGTDLRSLITSTTVPSSMAEHFALAEYVLLNNLSDSITISPRLMSNLMINGILQSIQFDEHGTPGMVSLFNNSYYYMAYSACLLEIIDQLKAKGLFSETLIVSGGEFNRNPKADGTGSDHGYTGGSSSFYCGALTGPLVLGNILKDDATQPNYRGTWGQAAPVTELGKTLDIGHWASTISYLLRVPSPITASPSLLVSNASTYVSIIEKARQV